jgi:hypothetical protein
MHRSAVVLIVRGDFIPGTYPTRRRAIAVEHEEQARDLLELHLEKALRSIIAGYIVDVRGDEQNEMKSAMLR